MMTNSSNRDSYSYDRLFYEYQREGALRSARALLPIVTKILTVRSVLDIGCGAGAWLCAYGELGVADHCGVDGDYVDPAVLLFDPRKFTPRNIVAPFALGRQFDLVQCLEVGEHVPPKTSRILVDNIVRHGKRVLFSAAVPGQGGEQHVNEQRYEFWRDLFAERGYRLFDFLRPRLRGIEIIESWYRYNILFFAHDDAVVGLPSNISTARVMERAIIKDYSPFRYRVRKAILRAIPQSAVSRLAIIKHNLVRRSIKPR
jgi:SAM-dependent methyltransferase